MSFAAFRTKIIAKQENARDRRQLLVSEHNLPTCFAVFDSNVLNGTLSGTVEHLFFSLKIDPNRFGLLCRSSEIYQKL